MTDLCACSAGTLARLIRDGEVSAAEVTRAHLERIERVNPGVNAVVTLVADYTDRPKEIHELLTRLTGSDLIPVLAIFPAGKPQEPIVLTGGYTTATLLAELEKAGASSGAVAQVGLFG